MVIVHTSFVPVDLLPVQIRIPQKERIILIQLLLPSALFRCLRRFAIASRRRVGRGVFDYGAGFRTRSGRHNDGRGGRVRQGVYHSLARTPEREMAPRLDAITRTNHACILT